MKTKLPNKIKSIGEAKLFLQDLINNNEIYHPEDDAHDILFNTIDSSEHPTHEERQQLNKLMDEVYSFNFDPCEFILNRTNQTEATLNKALLISPAKFLNLEEHLFIMCVMSGDEHYYLVWESEGNLYKTKHKI